NLVLPPGWLALGVAGLAEGNPLPALLATVVLGLIGSASLWRGRPPPPRPFHPTFHPRHAPPGVAAPPPPAPAHGGPAPGGPGWTCWSGACRGCRSRPRPLRWRGCAPCCAPPRPRCCC